MGKKKTVKTNKQVHQTQSFGSMVSRAALCQLGPEISRMINDMGDQISAKQISTLEMLYTRIVVLEKVLIDKLGITQDELTLRVSDVEDERDGLAKAGDVVIGDTTRVEIQTKTKDQEKYQGTTRMKIQNTGSGNTLGKEIEEQIIGMKTGEVKVVEFGQNKELLAQITLNKSSRPIPKEESNNEKPSTT